MTTIFTSPLEHFEPIGRSLLETHPQDDGTDDDNLASSILSNTPKQTSKSASFISNSTKTDEIWTIREVANGEEEIYSKGRCVYWTRNSLILKSFNFTEQVIKALWIKFNRGDHLCVALSSGISIFDKIGRHFQLPLPFTYQNIHESTAGLLIERNCDPLDDDTPMLFALTHPTHEVSPVLFRSFSRTNTQHLSKNFTCTLPPCMSIVTCHDTLPLCLVFNSQDLEYSIWKIRKTTNDETEAYQQINDESTLNTFTNYQSSCSFRDHSQASLSVSSKQRNSIMHQSNPSITNTMNFSPKMDLRSRHSTLGNLAASRLGAGCGQITSEANTTNIKSFSSAQTINMMSTPNRNRIINYLRDTIEEPIMPELILEQIWAESSTSNSARANRFFSTSDLVGDDFLVIVSTENLQLTVVKYKLHKDSAGIDFNEVNYIPAIDAMPITTMKMMIVVDCNKNLVLYSGIDKITYITVPQLSPSNLRALPSSSPVSLKHASDMTPIQMSSARKRLSAGGDRNSVGSDLSLQQMFRALSPVPHLNRAHDAKASTPVSLTDIKKIESIIGKSVYLINSNNQRGKFEVPPVCQTLCVKKLLDAMKLVVPKELGLTIMIKWYQARRSSEQSVLLSARAEMHLFKTWFLNALGITNDYFELDSGNLKASDSPIKAMYASPNKKSRKARDIESNPIKAEIYALFFAMHLVFEDLLLNRLTYANAYDLAELLMVISCLLKLEAYQEYYWIKFPILQQKFGQHKSHLESIITKPESMHKPIYFQVEPPSVMKFINQIIISSQLDDLFKKENVLHPHPCLKSVTDDTFTTVSLFCELFNIDGNDANVWISPSTTNFLNINILTTKPARSKEADQKVVMLMVKLGKTRDYLSCLPEAINLYLWDAILNCRDSPPIDWSEACFDLIGRMDLVSLVRGQSRLANRVGAGKNGDDETLKLIFPDDIRVSEAHSMLASDAPVEFSITQRQGTTEEESRDETHRRLYLLNVRTMAMPVGRGAICLRTYSPVIGESFEVPRLELCGRSLSEDRPIEYNHDISVYPWPFFHNGVAAGLTICASTANNIIDSTWINYNRPRSNIPHGSDMRDRDLTAANINNEHAGFLFALGLNGHLEKLSLMALHDYLCQNNDLTKLAILLGMSAAKRGSRDNNIIKVLSIHVDALLPPNSTELDVPAPVHAASIIGVGLLYQCSGDSHISKVLLEEIGRLPGPEANSHIDRESYSLSAGLAFGLVNLCKGGSTTIASSDQLRLYMLGGKRKPLTLSQKERYFKQDCHRGEEEYINTHITSPGGTLGLGLMYHRSSNQSVANWMRAPDTQTLLEYVRPDFLILRMLSYGLIMWDQIDSSNDWIMSQIPKIISDNAFQRNLSPTNNRLVSAPITTPSVDYELISQAYCNIITGCCMAMAMRYAGTADKTAFKTIYKHTRIMIKVSNNQALVDQAGRPCIEACLNVLVTSLAVIMAGTGDLSVMRICRYLRSRLGSCVFYGSYMALHMALGILFLGSCRYSLSTSPQSIGALVCALYPIYPNHTADNRYHLQALRHLYVLAAEPRLLIPKDIQTHKSVYVDITVKKHQRGSDKPIEIKLKAPCLVPEVDSIISICVDDERYWRIEISSRDALIKCLSKEQGYLSVKQKAHSANNQLVRDINNLVLRNMHKGVKKSHKMSALSECVKEDRVEQYSALNELLNNSQEVADKYLSLTLEQIRLALTLADDKTMNKINLLKPIIGRYGDLHDKERVHELWCDHLTQHADWTKTNQLVAHYIILNDLKFVDIDDDLLRGLRDFNLSIDDND